MAQASVSSHALDEGALLSYLRRNCPSFPQYVEKFHASQFKHGQSNPTFLLRVLGGHDGRECTEYRYVLRKKPPGKLLKSAHAVEREFQVLSALGRDRRVPVPRVHLLCSDVSILGTPFYIMDFVEGRLFTDPRLPGVPAEERRLIYASMAQTLAAIHSVNILALGLSSFGRLDSFCTRQVDRWSAQYRASTSDTKGEPDKEETAGMGKIIQWLKENIPEDDARAEGRMKGLVHGDFRLDNLIFHPTEARVVAVLDWELATLGSQISDLAYCCMPYHLPAVKGAEGLMPSLRSASDQISHQQRSDLPEGIPTEAEFVAIYSAAKAGDQWPASTWRFFLALSFFRASSIFAGVHQRSKQGNASSVRASGAGAFVPILSSTALSIISSPSTLSSSVSPSSFSPCSFLPMTPRGLEPSERAAELRRRVEEFVAREILPVEAQLEEHAASEARWTIHPLQEELKAKAKSEGLWNLWLPEASAKFAEEVVKGVDSGKGYLLGRGLSNLEYAHVCQPMGSSVWAPEVFNCSAPDTGNMEVLLRYGTKEQQREWLLPLLDASIRSCFAMTEPNVASSDATNMEATITRDGDEFVLSGRKWWTSGAMDPRCRLAIFMGRHMEARDSSTTGDKAVTKAGKSHRQHSMVLVDMRGAGVKVLRPLLVFGFDDAPHGHAEVLFSNVRVPIKNLLLGEGRGFEIAQGRLGPGRLHHCMRLIGAAERAMRAMVERASTRSTFGARLVERADVQKALAESRIQVEASRLLVLNAALQLDLHGNKVAKDALAMAKVFTPRAVQAVLDSTIQIHGAAGVSSDFPLARLWIAARTLRIADGPDEVHLSTIARSEISQAKAARARM